ncbi:Por secretion system C-terminal sorting domain-containing protein [Dysgonomonas macrotermitis]|uniref:Por secretion system C-terminal sorting domain-containing protein n=2 Tax=Dysgonomonas macrotermitis TaxID=1346286 RepID=A0A1M4WQU6_9BACT|nr:Por secretion system C-terminal sorting domain-containing protein [Dysgonomonas macrotermitis]
MWPCHFEPTLLMKEKIFLLLGVGFIPLALSAQSVPYLYNKGQMSVVSTVANRSNTALYIGGDFISEGVEDANMYLENAQVVLTGDLYRKEADEGNKGTNVFSWPKATGGGYDTSKASNFVFRAHATNPVAQHVWITSTAAKVDNSAMIFESKGRDYVNFPDVIVENNKHVTISPAIAAYAHNITLNTGRLILDSRPLNTPTDVLYTPPTRTLVNNEASILAHLYLDGTETHTARTASTSTLDDFGATQVNLALQAVDNANRRNDGDPIAGFGSPFKSMYADYFMYNFLFKPTGGTILNEDRNTNTDPKEKLVRGRGYVVGIDLRGDNSADYTDVHALYASVIKFEDRAKDGYKFGRFAYSNSNKNNLFQLTGTLTAVTSTSTVSSVSSDAYSGEFLNNDDVQAPALVAGFNYLSNPYTTPLDLDALLYNTSSSTWGVTSGYSNGTTTNGDIANRVWILDSNSTASGSYNFLSPGKEANLGNKWVVVSYMYRLMRGVGGTASITYDNGGGSSTLIGPLQMFVVYANTTGVGKTMTIPKSARSLDGNALFLRSGTTDYAKDDFLFQVKDVKTGKEDRTAVVLRTFDEISSNKNFVDITKLRTSIIPDETSATATTKSGDVSQTYMNLLYTKDTDGNALESKFLSIQNDEAVTSSTSTVSTTLYLTPAAENQSIEIRSYRNYTKERVQEIWLDDKRDSKSIKLSDGAIYSTTTKPTDAVDRFTLRFIRPVSGIDPGVTNPNNTDITAYYDNSKLTVSGFNDSDQGNFVSVYDIQGRLINRKKVEGSSLEFNDGFNVGAYIVKMTGSRSYATKFMAR